MEGAGGVGKGGASGRRARARARRGGGGAAGGWGGEGRGRVGAGGAGARGAAAAARALVGHLLYLRGQAPAPLEELRAQAECLEEEAAAAGGEEGGEGVRVGGPRRRGRRRRGQAGGRLQRRRLARFLGAADGVLGALEPGALASPVGGGEVRLCVLVLGPSVKRPLESYCLRSRCAAGAAEATGAGADARHLGRALLRVQQQVLRAVVAAEAERPEPRAGAGGRPTKLSVLVQVRAGEPSPPGFEPLPDFCLERMRQPPISLVLSEGGGGADDEAPDAAPPGGGGHVWHKCSYSVRGLPAGAVF